MVALDRVLTLGCQCGQVVMRVSGAPILRAACYCSDCQAAGIELQALVGAPRVLLADGGTDFLLYRKDRVAFVCGEELLKPFKLKESSSTYRAVAECCNSPMFLEFSKGHWLSLYRDRFLGEVPPLEMRTCTKYKRADVVLDDTVPNLPMHSFKFYVKLLAAWIPMLFKWKS